MTATVLHGDCRAVLAEMPADSFEACLTDPPYHLQQIGRTFQMAVNPNSSTGNVRSNNEAYRHRAGFMGKEWDGGDVAFRPETWAAVLRVLKPGAHMLCFGGTRTQHRMVCAIEDAGFEIRDTLLWVTGQGFPKSHNLDGEWQGFGTALKPAVELLCLARKPLSERTVAANVLRHGCGALNIAACRINPGEAVPGGGGLLGGAASRHEGWQRPAHLNGAPTEAHTLGRWPANLAHDGSPEVLAAFAAAGESKSPTTSSKYQRSSDNACYTMESGSNRFRAGAPIEVAAYGDTGSAARFFFSPKADKADRAGSSHPTVKPVDLIRHYLRLITPPGGTVLDCFAGSGTTAEAAMLEGFDATLIEQDAASVADIRHRMARWSGADTPLFAAEAAD